MQDFKSVPTLRPSRKFSRWADSFSSTEALPAFLADDRDHDAQDFRASLEIAIVALGYFALFCVIMGACAQADRLYSLLQGLSQ
jgi:hypothetical protein